MSASCLVSELTNFFVFFFFTVCPGEVGRLDRNGGNFDFFAVTALRCFLDRLYYIDG